DAGPPVGGRRGGGERRAERGEVDRLAPRGELEVVAVLGEDARERLRGGGRAPEALEERDEAAGELADDGAVVDERVARDGEAVLERERRALGVAGALVRLGGEHPRAGGGRRDGVAARDVLERGGVAPRAE